MFTWWFTYNIGLSKRCDKFNYLCFFSFLVKSIVLKMYHSKAAAFFKAILRSTQVTRLIVFFSLYSKGFCRRKNIEFISIFYMCCRGTGHTTGVKLDFPFEHSLIQKKMKRKKKERQKKFLLHHHARSFYSRFWYKSRSMSKTVAIFYYFILVNIGVFVCTLFKCNTPFSI